jgi:hypothetical protein
MAEMLRAGQIAPENKTYIGAGHLYLQPHRAAWAATNTWDEVLLLIDTLTGDYVTSPRGASEHGQCRDSGQGSGILHRANAATPSAIRPPNRVTHGPCGNDLLLEACSNSFPRPGQTQIGDIAEIIRAVDLHNVTAMLCAVIPSLHEPNNPNHASTSGQRTEAKIPCPRVEQDHRRITARVASTFAIQPQPAKPPTRSVDRRQRAARAPGACHRRR